MLWSPQRMTLEESLVFQPARYPEGNWTPEFLAFQDVWIREEAGSRLHGWYCEAANPQAVILFCHGNAGNITHRAALLELLNTRLQAAVLAFDYSGYGRSEGLPSEEQILQDARDARRWLAKRAGVSQRAIVLMGRSLGGAVAVDLAAGDGARALVLLNTFTRLPDVAWHHAGWVSGLMRMRLDSLSKITNYSGPLLLMHGTADEVIPKEQGDKLFAAAASTEKQFVSVVGGRHNDAPTEESIQALDAFLRSLP